MLLNRLWQTCSKTAKRRILRFHFDGNQNRKIKTEHFHPSPGTTEPLVVVVDHLLDKGEHLTEDLDQRYLAFVRLFPRVNQVVFLQVSQLCEVLATGLTLEGALATMHS